MSQSWSHFGIAGHFIGGQSCRFHLFTLVGPWIVSTVGEYCPRGERSEKPQEIGSNRLYETMVFKADGVCDCGCMAPKHDGSNLDFEGYNDPRAATIGHAEMCAKWDGRTEESL